MPPINKLKPGDKIEIIAPASRCSAQELDKIKELLSSWHLQCLIQQDIFGKDLLCANSDEIRFDHLKHALINPEIKALFCVRGGYGSMRLIPRLEGISKPIYPKALIGFSDITALHLFLQQQWDWSTVHGSANPIRFSEESIKTLKSILFEPNSYLKWKGLEALNAHALNNTCIQSSLTGGNLALIQAGIGTSWQLDCQDKILLLEDIGERAYKIDRMLEHLIQAQIIQKAAAVLFGDFLQSEEPKGISLVDEVLQRFALSFNKPVIRIRGIGHGFNNIPMPFGTQAILQLGQEIQLKIKT